MSKFLKVEISAENRKQADEIFNALLNKKLVAGGVIVNSPARFWWKNKIMDMDYYTLSAFTIGKNKKKIIDAIRKTSIEEVPMIWFFQMDGNSELLNWIEESLK